MSIKIALFVAAVIFIVQMISWQTNAAPADDNMFKLDAESKAKVDKALEDIHKTFENLAKQIQENELVQNLTKSLQEQTQKLSDSIKN